MNKTMEDKKGVNRGLAVFVALWSVILGTQNLYFSQTSSNSIIILKTIADKILSEQSYSFVDTETGKRYTNLERVKSFEEINLVSQYANWRYENGVLNIAMLRLSELLKDNRYGNFTFDNIEFIFQNKNYFINKPKNKSKWEYPFGQFFALEQLDDCGSMGASLIDVYQKKKNDKYFEYLLKAGNHILNIQHRLKDGTLCRLEPVEKTVWADDLFMSVPFLARMGELTGEKKYFDDAVKQVIQFYKYLWDTKTELYFHGWYSNEKVNGVAHWGRANGWVIVAQVELLKILPNDHPKRNELIKILKQQIDGVARYQSQSGLWHQLLDKNDSYLETSCTAMFTYGIAAAVNEGWIPEHNISIAQNGWEGLKSKITGIGQVKDICVGTGIEKDLGYYYNRPTKLQDIHGLGAVILAGTEIVKYEKNKNK